MGGPRARGKFLPGSIPMSSGTPTIKRVPTDNNEAVMAFEEWSTKTKPKQQLQKVWVQVYGVPYEIRSFLPLWAVGTIIGSTQRVDMRYMRKNDIVRLLVNVPNVEDIPDTAEIGVNDFIYDIFFKVDKVMYHDQDGDEFDYVDDLDDDEGLPDGDHELEDVQDHNGENSNDPKDTTSFVPPEQKKGGQNLLLRSSGSLRSALAP